ncbi:MAG: DNA polymerase III subunit gamma/tau [Gammaproteobacteria bacterium]|nr:DNA polymerase III subunit gamma/tau [Gammaproteobacteria bacterium]
MSYQVLARKWRPQTFQSLVGQEHVQRALVNALDHDRLHHAYLFTGTRGVGKTTIARILAKCLNCETGVTSTPCGTCPSCRDIEQGRFVDLIEVDAASRTKVEDTRELLDNVQYAPSRGRYKVYLIDEVHMLSGHSFNALLKTLEEPPPHVKFLLATTDPQKVPVTVLSRCLQFNLKRLSPERIRDHLAHILAEEGIEAEPPALLELALAADGSMRDALSLLDQAIAFGGGRLEAEEVRNMLGTLDRGRIFELLELLAAGDAAALLDRSAGLAEQAPDYGAVLGELVSLLHRVALAQLVPEAVDDRLGDRDRVLALAGRIEPEEVQLWYQIGLLGRRDLPLAPDPRGGFEMLLLRMLAFRPATAEAAPAPAGSGGGEARGAREALDQARARAGGGDANAPGMTRRAAPAPSPGAESRPRPSAHRPAGAAEPCEVREPEAGPAGNPAPALISDWAATVPRLGLNGFTLQLANHCVLDRVEGQSIRLLLDPAQSSALSERLKERIHDALSRYLGQPVRLDIVVGAAGTETPARQQQRARSERQHAAEAHIQADPNVQALMDTFDASLVPGSIRPTEH